jgi:carboxymethylenebutenolidase
MVSFGKGRGAGTGYMAFSDRVGPGVLVLHEFFGLQQSFRDYADALRNSGFTVLVPDLYEGVVARDLAEARSLADALDVDHALRRLTAAAEHLTANWHPRLGCVGFSLGAYLASALAQEGTLEATVLYYGLGEVEPANWRGSLLGHFAERDEWEDLAVANDVFKALEEHGVEAELHVYPGTGHWFANPGVENAYEARAAELARERTIDFLRYHLA